MTISPVSLFVSDASARTYAGTGAALVSTLASHGLGDPTPRTDGIFGFQAAYGAIPNRTIGQLLDPLLIPTLQERNQYAGSDQDSTGALQAYQNYNTVSRLASRGSTVSVSA